MDGITSVVSTNALVIPYDIVGVKESGQLASLDLPAQDRIHAWMVTQIGANAVQAAKQTFAEYEYIYAVWQFYEHIHGNATTHSEHLMSTERDAVTLKFAGTRNSPVACGSRALSFSTIGTFYVVDKLIHIAQGTMSVMQTVKP